MLSLRRSYSLTSFALLAAVATAAPGAAIAEEITITVTSVKGLDKVDELSGGDYFARMTIDGDVQNSTVVKDVEFKPDWKLSKSVSAGKHDVKLELIDKDLAEDDPVDINRMPNKRSLEFSVDTKSCKIEGFSSTYRCGKAITRAGDETKKAAITFKVTVRK
jgi:hypothetical protein